MLNSLMKLNPKLFCDDVEKIAVRDGYGKGLLEAGKKDERVVALSADLCESTKANVFSKEFPNRFIEVGVAEQNLLGVAAGLSFAGKIPFASSFAAFSPGRNWDQLRVSVAYSKANVKVIGSHAGITVGPDGATHQALEDIAITRVIPDLAVEVPCDWIECKKTTLEIARKEGPVYLRFGRDKTAQVTSEETPFELGKAQVFREGSDCAIIACGMLVYEALVAAEKLAKENNIECIVVNNHSIKPIDEKTIVESAKKTGFVVTCEEHQIDGGMGSAVCEVLAENYPVPVFRHGVNNLFGESGSSRELMKKYGLTSETLVDHVKTVLSANRK